MRKDGLLQIRDATESGSVEQRAGCVDRLTLVHRAPAAHRVVVLEREADGIHQLVTAGACRIRAVLRQRSRMVAFFPTFVASGGHRSRRRRRRHAEHVIENPFAANDRRRARRIRRHQQDAALTKQAAARAVFTELDAAEAAPVDVRDAVVLGQPLVHERCSSRAAGRARCGSRG